MVKKPNEKTAVAAVKPLEKVVNRTGKELPESKVVLKKAIEKKVSSKEDIAKLNEKVASKKQAKVAEVQEAVKTEQPTSTPEKKYHYELSVGMKDLFDAGCHLGHKIGKTHPRVGDYLYGPKDGVQVFDLPKTMEALQAACDFVYGAAKEGKTVCFVGTKRQAREVVKRVAEEINAPYITDRWLGGTITNWGQIINFDSTNPFLKNKYASLSKKDQSLLRKEFSRLTATLAGIGSLEKLFDVLFVVDIGTEKTAVREAGYRSIPVVGVVDSDSNPHSIDFPIPANDDSVKSLNLLVSEVGKAISAGRKS